MSSESKIKYHIGNGKTKTIKVSFVPEMKITSVAKAVRCAGVVALEGKNNKIYALDLARLDMAYNSDVWERDLNLGKCLVKLGRLSSADLKAHTNHREAVEENKTKAWWAHQIEVYTKKTGMKLTPEQKKFLKAKKVL